jgi:hypothetical protein
MLKAHNYSGVQFIHGKSIKKEFNKSFFFRAFRCWDTSIQNKLKCLFLDNSDQQFLTLIHFFRYEEDLPVSAWTDTVMDVG